MLLSPVAVRDPVKGAAFEYSSEASHRRERTFPDTPSELEQACIQVNVAALGSRSGKQRLRCVDLRSAACARSLRSKQPSKKNSLSPLPTTPRKCSHDFGASECIRLSRFQRIADDPFPIES